MQCETMAGVYVQCVPHVMDNVKNKSKKQVSMIRRLQKLDNVGVTESRLKTMTDPAQNETY